MKMSLSLLMSPQERTRLEGGKWVREKRRMNEIFITQFMGQAEILMRAEGMTGEFHRGAQFKYDVFIGVQGMLWEIHWNECEGEGVRGF